MTISARKGDQRKFYVSFWKKKQEAYVVTGYTIRFTAKQFLSDSDSNAKISKVTGGQASATVTGTIAETYNITAANKKFYLKVDGGTLQTFTLTEGATQTAAQVAADLVGVGFTASAVGGKVKFTAASSGGTSTLEIVAGADSAYTVLGFTVGLTRGVSAITVVQHPDTGVNNRCLVTIDPADTASLPFKGMSMKFDIQVTDISGQNFTVLSGDLEILPDVRNSSP